MTPKQYFEEVAEPTVAEFLLEPTSVRLTLLACMTCYHVIDALAVDRGRRKASKLYDELVLEQPSLRIIKAVALLAKHVEPNQAGFQVRSDHLKKSSGAAFSDGTYYSDGTSHAGSRDVVVLQSPGFSKTDLSHALSKSMSFLKAQIALG